VHLTRTSERVDEVREFVAAQGGAVGIAGVLADLNRRAHAVHVPARAATWGFRWNEQDGNSKRWWPQGITSSADIGPGSDFVDGRAVLCTSWYSKDVDGLNKGSRVTFVDITSARSIGYRHVLLVEPVVRDDGRIDVRPVKVHAGGIVWHGSYLHVAGTERGLYTFRIGDIVRSPTTVLGYRYLLPARFTYAAHADDGFERLRYSFLSLDRSSSPVELLAGEYGRGSSTTRLVRYELSPETDLLLATEDGVARPLELHSRGLEGMQGAVRVGGRYYVTTSAGRWRSGSLYVGRPGAFTKHARVLPVGVEDICFWPSRNQLFSLSEYPGRRYVFAMNRSQFD
jgi:hypothetical protein